MRIKPMPKQSILHSLLEYNPETGEFIRKPCVERKTTDKMWNINFAYKTAGSRGIKSIVIGVNGMSFPAHRLAWVYVYGDILSTDLQVDHINNDPFDNRITNLRLATHAQNCSNARKWKNKILPKGVRALPKDKYQARLQCNKKTIHIGTFPTVEAAYEAYCNAARIHHGEFSRV